MSNFPSTEKFVDRHIGPDEKEIASMLEAINVNSLDELITETIPDDIRIEEKLKLDKPLSEYQFLTKIKTIAKKNKVFKSYIGLGYYPTMTPSVILRNIFENPGWYTQYTPYQAEISQGRLEALLNFQNMITDLTGMKIANSSLLDEGTAAAEAMLMCNALRKRSKPEANVIFVSEECFPQTIAVVRTRAEAIGVEVKIGDHRTVELDDQIFAVLIQYPASDGEVYEYKEFFDKAEDNKILKIVAADILSLVLLKPPGEFGADIVVGSTQRLGVPMGFGGPHAAYFATKDEYKRNVPGRIIGISVDAQGNEAYRMALQTREQHIKRDKATSNICTAQVLLSIIAGMYAVYHGPEGLKNIAQKIFALTKLLDDSLRGLGYKQVNKNYFDTLKVEFYEKSKDKIQKIKELAEAREVNFRYFDNYIGISMNEITDLEDVAEITSIFSEIDNADVEIDIDIDAINVEYSPDFARTSDYLRHPVFNSHHSEMEMMRYIKYLENRDLSLTGSMIPLGSCTMKLSAVTEMMGISWQEFTDIHPFAPLSQSEGYMEIIKKLEDYLCKITGFAGISLQPNSGAQGEYSGLMIIRKYYNNKGDKHRNIVLIPASAHGTNPASAIMAGMEVIVIKCDNKGNIDVSDLKEKSEGNKENLAALMVTYPSTHGVFETAIKEICEIIHENGGQIYLDGANMNAQVGLTSPAMIGADVCHLNLHKTFAIPHGGGGPGVGPIGVASHLVPFLPGHPLVKTGGEKAISAISSAPWGSPLVLIISYAYILMMGEDGLTKASKVAILNANYVMKRLKNHYKVLYTGERGRVAHELIFDFREFKAETEIDVEDVSKRLMDYSFHAPTVSFPVPGTMMFEPTESESKTELDRFCDAMISIREEISEIQKGDADKNDNLLKNAPHTALVVTANEWTHPYLRQRAAYPIDNLKRYKFWTPVSRIDNAYGDRNLICCWLPNDEKK